MPGVNDWLAVAEAEDDELRERILTGYKSGKPFTPYVPTVALPAPMSSVLDFGCGLGRNFPYLTTVAARVDGFDLPPMIARCRLSAPESRVNLSDDWQDLSCRRYDLIFASLVLQHLDSEPLAVVLGDFSRMAPATYVLTRGCTDGGANVLQLVKDAGCFDVAACAIVEHDPKTHQLRRVALVPFRQAVDGDPDAHYDLLLRSR